MLVSARRGISYPNPDRSDRPDIPQHILNLVNALEVDAVYAQGTDTARIARAHMAGTFFWTTDTLHLWYDDGAAWRQIDANAGSINLVGTFAARPGAGTVPAGTRYFATDTLGEWRSDGAATWTLVDQGIPLIAPASLSTLPGPYDGQLVALQVDATNGVNWTFRYNSGSASAFKWEAIGSQNPLFSEVATDETTTSTTYAALTTAGPSVTPPRNGDYDVEIGVVGYGSASVSSMMSYDIGGTGAVDADDVQTSGQNAANTMSNVARRRRKTGLTGGQALVSKYKAAAASTQHLINRWMAVYPVRIS